MKLWTAAWREALLRLKSRRRAAVASLLAVSLACASAITGLGGVARAANGPHIGDTPLASAIVPAARPLQPPNPALAALGKQLFRDVRLSSPRGTSCASCHDPQQAFTGFNGGRDGVAAGSVRSRLGSRNPPSLTYVRYVPPLYFYQDDDAQLPSPFGGLMLDGRADTLARQVREPLLARHEMNLGSARVLAHRLRDIGYQAEFERQFGKGVLHDGPRALDAVGLSLQSYLESDELAPFDSRFDDLLRGRAALTQQELRGLALFRNPDKGNCASCHSVSVTSSNPARSLFTDFGYEALGVPRNRKLPLNRSPAAYDLGLCRTAQARHWPEPDAWCGYFRTPSLRNVAVRSRFMHNGVIDALRDAVRFYATRSTSPKDWYGNHQPFDDLPAKWRGNVNTVSTPLNRPAGTTAALDDNEIDDIVAFLRTLTDRRYLHENASGDEGRSAERIRSAGR